MAAADHRGKPRHFLYLMQGASASLEAYAQLAERANADAIFLTYDKPLAGAIFAPESRWGEGRNLLLKAALEKPDYLYYIFCDNDIDFQRGSWALLERELLRYRPAIAVPMFHPKNSSLSLRWLSYQACLINDEQLIAVHRQVVEDGIAVPYQAQFDADHYWATGLSQQLILKNFYFYDLMQLNNICVGNDSGSGHPGTPAQSRLAKAKLAEWMRCEFKHAYKKDLEYIRYHRHAQSTRALGLVALFVKLHQRWYFWVVALWHTAVLFLRRLFTIGDSDHALEGRKLRRLLQPNSRLLQQYFQSKSACAERTGDRA